MNKKTIFVNGCFDLLHAGHVELLKFAATLGSLVVGLNSDESIKKLKGNGRPIVNQENRRLVLDALECVDRVFVFNEETPLELIKKIKPDILVRGTDDENEMPVGSDFVANNGGEIVLFRRKKGISTTDIIQKTMKGN